MRLLGSRDAPVGDRFQAALASLRELGCPGLLEAGGVAHAREEVRRHAETSHRHRIKRCSDTRGGCKDTRGGYPQARHHDTLTGKRYAHARHHDTLTGERYARARKQDARESAARQCQAQMQSGRT
eukprot:820590-Rhodomonas_salina.1